MNIIKKYKCLSSDYDFFLKDWEYAEHYRPPYSDTFVAKFVAESPEKWELVESDPVVISLERGCFGMYDHIVDKIRLMEDGHYVDYCEDDLESVVKMLIDRYNLNLIVV